jgi:GH15 family glucan-1,4-alpha-glucosidase
MKTKSTDKLNFAGAPIEDYAMIGDGRTAALVSRGGSIDWLCMPRFDSEACFAALLGTVDHGHWRIAPKGKAKVTRCYRDETLILETTFETRTGRVMLTDFMPANSDRSCIVRRLTGVSGTVSLETELVIRFDYGVTVPWVNRIDDHVLTAVAGPNMLVMHTAAALHGEDMRTVGDFKIKKGDALDFVLTHASSIGPLPPSLDVNTALTHTDAYWRRWSAQYKQGDKWGKEVKRSLITLKGLNYRPTGGIVAAPTTSLPEQWGGARNWDYRYCWLRDATFTLLAFLNAGYREEADDWQNWLLRAVAGSPEQVHSMYGVAGERRLDEWEVPWLPGYHGASPVRIGNAASGQMQLDIYGELADAIAQAMRGGLPRPPRQRALREAMLQHLERMWRQPDSGIWEIRGPPQHFTHSKVMAWVAFDRAWRVTEKEAGNKRLCAHWKNVAREIHADVCKNGVDKDRGCFVQAYGSDHMDASLLLLADVGFLPASDVRIRKTVKEIERCLMRGGLVRRYQTDSGVDGLEGDEGVFLACSFWLVDNYVLEGRLKDANRLFRRLLRLCNDVGLLSEEYDPKRKCMMGNFPQAFSHVALVNSAINLMQAEKAQKVRPKGKREEKPVRRHEKQGR